MHDPRAFRLGGVAGHAGLFSTADNLVRYAQMILGGGKLGDARIMSAETVRKMLAPHDLPGGIRALGWDMQSSYSANRGQSLSRRAVGHGGYTGTALWIDPQNDLFVLFLSNRVHPDGKGAINALAGQIGTLAGESLAEPAAPEPAPPERLAVGIDVLKREGFARLRGARVGLLANDSARAASGEPTIEALAKAPGMSLVALLTPEHGKSAQRDERISDSVERSLQLPVYSLYGKVLRPTPAMLTGLDTLVVDLPDVGARFYTYASTLHETMKAVATLGLRVMVLDQPNPIDGVDVAGPVLVDAERSFVNHFSLPVRHGMTLGELAEMMNAVEHLGVDLEVVRVEGWSRDAYAEPQAWIAPSPNLRTLDQAILYPGVALLEGTNVSVGRGTEAPFELVGAPFIDASRFSAGLVSDAFRGVAVEPAEFTPTAGTHLGQRCHGVRLRIVDRAQFEPVRAGLALAQSSPSCTPESGTLLD